MKSIDDLPSMTIETTASMQEQLARRDHRIAVLEAIVAAKTARIAVLEAREGNGGSPAIVRTFEVEASYTVAGPPEGMLAIVTKHLNGSCVRSMERLATDAGSKFNAPDGGTTVAPPSHSVALSRAMTAPGTNPRLGVIHER